MTSDSANPQPHEGEQLAPAPAPDAPAGKEKSTPRATTRTRAARLVARLKPWLRRYQLVFLLPIALLVGLAIGGPGDGDGKANAEAGHEEHGDNAATAEDEPTIWTCSMHPQIRLPEPGKCPICGMDLIPLKKGDSSKDAPSPKQVVLSERAKILARIETAEVRRADTAVELRLLGRLMEDETKVRTITPWVDGRIDRLFVSAVGEKIKRGQTIASMYSPEVYAAMTDLVQAERQLDRLKKALPIAKGAAEAAVQSSRDRLRLLGISPKSASKDRKVSRNVAIKSSYAGTVIEQLVHEGAYVKAGTPLYKTADLTTLWAQLDAYEDDLARVAVDQKVTLVISTFPGETFEGTVAFIDPVVDARSRTARIRVEVPNEDGRLSPGMFADAVIHAPEQTEAEPQLVIPATAALFTGKRSVVFVQLSDKDQPTYEAREVRLGPRAGDTYPVMSGLQEGARVVVRGAFALDADLQIQGGESMMTLEDDQAREARAPVEVNDKFLAGLAPVLEAYLDVHDKLAADDTDGAKQAFALLAKRVNAFDPRAPEQAREAWQKMAKPLLATARQQAKAADLAELRRGFEQVSMGMIEALQRFGNPLSTPVRLAFCPMAFDNKGALWLQQAGEIENPFFGPGDMHRCGEIRHSVVEHQRLGPHAGHLAKPKPAAAPAGHQH